MQNGRCLITTPSGETLELIENYPKGDKVILMNIKEKQRHANVNQEADINIMLFKIENRAKNRTSHTGVLEFIADEGKVYLPGWMMRNLVLSEEKVLNPD